jgi:hypothetical protein
MHPPAVFQSKVQTVAAVVGENLAAGDGVFGIGHGVTGRGIVGTSEQQNGVTGITQHGTGVWGVGGTGNGVFGETQSSTSAGVVGQNTVGGRGVFGFAEGGGDGVFGSAVSRHIPGSYLHGGRGVVGISDDHTGVEGGSTNGAGVWGGSKNGEGVHGETQSDTLAAIAGFNRSESGTGAGIFGSAMSPSGYAGYFSGNVSVIGDAYVSGKLTVDGDIILTNADCAEEFDVLDPEIVGPGTVVVLTDDGALRASDQAYDRKAAGVVSGAGAFRPAIVLDRRPSVGSRCAIAMLGKVACKADAAEFPIAVGDLLTTSATRGHAMKATDPERSFGAVIGKALEPLASGTGMIAILVALQ